ncbi:hypothetical protein KFE98_08200 [bacterium SCSIO 12741]|nr:hypothetical protein KFE98_08200 [bacterium SCSIO 12741]
MKEENERSIYALLIGLTVGFASGAYLFSRKNSVVRDKIEAEIKNFYHDKVELNDKQKNEINRIKSSLLSILDELSGRIKNSMNDGKES